MSYIQPEFRILGSFIPKGSKIFSMGFIKSDFECCVPFGVTLNAVDMYKRGKLEMYDGIVINTETVNHDELNSVAETLLKSERPITILDNLSLNMDSWKAAMTQQGYHIYTKLPVSDKYQIIQLRKKIDSLPATKEVLVLSQYHLGNFGERVGFHLLTPLLPEHANVTYGTLNPFNVPEKKYDLVILGYGNSLDESKHCIGIFGTQYRERILSQDIKHVLGSLDYWFARHQDDLCLYGEHAKQAMHFGDWTIHLANMVEPVKDKQLEVGEAILQNHPLDRTIQSIQQYKQILSKHSRTAAIAFTSADSVIYQEQQGDKDYVSGKFSSLFIDVFGFAAPINMEFKINKQRVREYKRFVANNIDTLKSVIDEYLA